LVDTAFLDFLDTFSEFGECGGVSGDYPIDPGVLVLHEVVLAPAHCVVELYVYIAAIISEIVVELVKRAAGVLILGEPLLIVTGPFVLETTGNGGGIPYVLGDLGVLA
jgi:hypothetical protein